MLRAIVGLELPIAEWVGKRKLGQDRPAADRLGVAEGLPREDPQRGAAVARLVPEASGAAPGDEPTR
jgi:transcriptional regulator